MEMIEFFREMEPGSSLELFRESLQGEVREQAAYPKAEMRGTLSPVIPFLKSWKQHWMS